MFRVVLLCAGVMAADRPAPAAPAPEDLATYQVAQAQAGRDAEAHVRLALWCEAHGLEAERLKQLALAVLFDPTHTTARGLLGLVADDGQWRRPEAVARRVRDDATLAARLAEYNARREQARDTAESQWNLALWCEKQGLEAEAVAHFTAVTRLDPGREAAWKRLGYRRHDGRWMTAEQAAAETAEAEEQKKANQHWQPLLEKWRSWLGETARRGEAEAALAELSDPRAVPAIWRVFGLRTAAHQVRAVQLLGQLDAPTASRALAILAVSGKTAEVRRVATETLRRRDPRDFVGSLIGLLRAPLRYEVRPVDGPHSPGVLFVEGQRFNQQRIYTPPAPEVQFQPGDTLSYDASGLPVLHRYLGTYEVRRTVPNPGGSNRPDLAPSSRGSIGELAAGVRSQFDQIRAQALGFPWTSPVMPVVQARPDATEVQTIPREAQIPIGQMMAEAARVAQRQLESDVNQIKQIDRAIQESNHPVLEALTALTGQDFGEDLTAWKTWWTDQLGYSYSPSRPTPRPTFVQQVPLAQPRPIPVALVDGPAVGIRIEAPAVSARVANSCFGAGTPVRTREGLRPIEAIRVGDRALTQDPDTGSLSFQPVLAVYHNPPNRTLRIALGDETIVATPIHRFWRAGRGWAMARDLKPGDAVRTLGGVARVTSVEAEAVQPVFNLEVAQGHSFFAGTAGALVHDNSLVEPTPEPFDAGPRLAAASPGGP